jgi:uncharacterized membrane protein YgcG
MVSHKNVFILYIIAFNPFWFWKVVLIYLFYILFRYGSEDVINPLKYPQQAVPRYNAESYKVNNAFLPSYIFDPEGYLTISGYKEINRLLFNITKETNFEFLIVVVNSIKHRESPETFARNVFDRFGVGDRIDNTGIMLMLSIEEHKIQYLTGKGVKFLIRNKHFEKITEEMGPYLRAEKYDEVCI